MCEHCSEEMKAAQAYLAEVTAEVRKELEVKKRCPCEEHMANFGKAIVAPNGDIVYAKKGNEPPPDIEGFERDPNDWWRFKRKWSPCCYRIQVPHIKPCGAYSINTSCNHPDLPHEQVTFQKCETCPFRQ